MAAQRVTIQDLADHLGLSKFSVSRALSGKPGVGEATRNRVIRAARSMGYRLVQDVAYTVGHILFIRQEIDPVSSELWLNIMNGAEQEGERLGFAIVPRQARYLSEGGEIDSSVAGIILAVPRPSEWTGIARTTGLPVVCASYASPDGASRSGSRSGLGIRLRCGPAVDRTWPPQSCFRAWQRHADGASRALPWFSRWGV